MNLISLQSVSGPIVKSTNDRSLDKPSAESFGTVFNRIAVNVREEDLAEHQTMDTESDDLLQAIFQATTMSQLYEDIQDVDLESIKENVLKSLEELAESDSFLEPGIAFQSDWDLLDAIDQVAQPFFANLLESLEGKGELTKRQATEIVMQLKMIELSATETELVWAQQSLLVNLQNNLKEMSHRLETNARNSDMQLHLTRMVSFISNAGSELLQDGNAKNNPESSLPALSSTPHPVASTQNVFSNHNVAANNSSETLVREMELIFKRAGFGQTGGTNRLLIKLYPEHLGQIRIELLQTNGVMTARILASTVLGKELLDSQLNHLRNAFVQQNLQVDRIDVSQSVQQPFKNGQEQSFNGQFSREQKNANEEQDATDEDERTFQEYLIELEA